MPYHVDWFRGPKKDSVSRRVMQESVSPDIAYQEAARRRLGASIRLLLHSVLRPSVRLQTFFVSKILLSFVPKVRMRSLSSRCPAADNYVRTRTAFLSLCAWSAFFRKT